MRISLICATYNRGKLLAQSLPTWLDVDEIIIVDDGGTDHTEAICRNRGVRYLYNNHPGATSRCHAMNCALREANYEQILVCDAEIRFVTPVVKMLRAARARMPDDILTAEFCRWQTETGWELKPGGNVGLYARDWLYEVQGWDEDLPAPTGWDDWDLHSRLDYNGHVQVMVDGAVTEHWRHWVHPMNRQNWSVVSPNHDYVSTKPYPESLVANKGKQWGRLRGRHEDPLLTATCGGGACGSLS